MWQVTTCRKYLPFLFFILLIGVLFWKYVPKSYALECCFTDNSCGGGGHCSGNQAAVYCGDCGPVTSCPGDQSGCSTSFNSCFNLSNCGGCVAISCVPSCGLGGCPGGCGNIDNCGGATCGPCGGGGGAPPGCGAACSCTTNIYTGTTCTACASGLTCDGSSCTGAACSGGSYGYGYGQGSYCNPNQIVSCNNNSCTGSPANKTCTNGCGNPATVGCTGNIDVRAMQVFESDPTCTGVASSSAAVVPTTFTFSASSPVRPVGTQTTSAFVAFNGIRGGTYTLVPSPPPNYVLQTVCLAGVSGSLTENLSIPTDGSTLVWQLGYTKGTAWTQAQGGDVYGANTIHSFIPFGLTPRSFVLDGSGNLPGVVTYGTDYDFDMDPASKGQNYVSSKNWLSNVAYNSVDYYQLFYKRFGSPTVPDAIGDLTAVAQPASRTTPYYVVGNMTTSGNWNVAAGQSIVFLVNGNLTIGGKINITSGGFISFIVNGNISVSPSVGGLFSDNNPQVEGIYITSTAGTFMSGASTTVGKERLVVKGTVVAGNFQLQRDLDTISQNTTTPSELFVYNPQLLITMPDAMRDVPLTWQEAAP